MNRILILVAIIIISNSAFSQQTDISLRFTKQDYLRKSRHQHKAAMAFGLPGAGLFILGGYLFTYGVTEETLESNERKTTILMSLGLLFTGGGLAIISDRFERASALNKKKAISLSLKNEIIPQIQGTGFVYHSMPSLVLKLRF